MCVHNSHFDMQSDWNYWIVSCCYPLYPFVTPNAALAEGVEKRWSSNGFIRPGIRASPYETKAHFIGSSSLDLFSCVCVCVWINTGLRPASSQAVRRWFLTSETCIESRVTSSMICSRPTNTGRDFSTSFFGFPLLPGIRYYCIHIAHRPSEICDGLEHHPLSGSLPSSRGLHFWSDNSFGRQ